MKNTRRPSTQDYSKLIGIPYEVKDCWGVVVEFYKVCFGFQLDPYYQDIPVTRDNAKDVIYSCMQDFVQVPESDRKFGDILLIKMFGVESHIAVYLENDRILHTTHKTGCCIDRALRWKHLIVGYYRVKDDTAS